MARPYKPSVKANLISRVQAELILRCDPGTLPLRTVRSFVKADQMFIRKEVMALARKLARERKAKAD